MVCIYDHAPACGDQTVPYQRQLFASRAKKILIEPFCIDRHQIGAVICNLLRA